MGNAIVSAVRRVAIYGRVSTEHEAQLSAFENQQAWPCYCHLSTLQRLPGAEPWLPLHPGLGAGIPLSQLLPVASQLATCLIPEGIYWRPASLRDLMGQT